MHRSIYNYFIFIISFLCLVACGNAKQLTTENQHKLPKMKTKLLVHRLDSLSAVRPNFFYAKMKTRYSSPDNDVSFKASVKMVKDSATNILITFAHIPVYVSMITRDSFALVDKRHHCYIKRGIDYFKQQFHVDFTYQNIEEILLGMPLGWEEFTTHYRIKDPYHYIISAKKKRTNDIHQEEERSKDMAIRYYLSNDGKYLNKTEIDRPQDSVYITIHYLDRETINGFNLPTRESVEIKANGKTMNLDFSYYNSTINERRVLYLSVPKKYKRCE